MGKSDQPRAPGPVKQTGRKQPIGQSGTALAVKDTIPSGGLSPAGRRWGGARNRADRTSEYLTLRHCRNLIAWADQAQRIGLPFNRHWTVHYERAGIAEIDAARFIGRLLKLAGDYARRHNGNFAVMWVRENGDGKGGHVHILLHLPASLALRGRTAHWVRLAGGKCCARVSRVRSIGHALKSADNGGEHYRHNVDKVLAYVMKGADADAGAALGLARYGERGNVVGKRCGRTQNIGMAANARLYSE
ncbi:hypothetical protein [Novosphingobium fuchskuhlense]|uniref:hypothetical protein n=1 Tax=Novosphingobium fuchskuhlense TaxID=1117702 RepID=UPI000A570413|nr:hypothetical protein [Novosphingobium fuchskuhlense]